MRPGHWNPGSEYNQSFHKISLHSVKKDEGKMEKPYSIELVDDITVIRLEAMPDTVGVLNAIDEAAELEPTRLRLWDWSKGVDFTSTELQHIVSFGTLNKSSLLKEAVYAPQDLAFGIARMFEVYKGPGQDQYEVFRTEQEAISWLRTN